ncbi:MAG: type II secretion system F family protein [Chloroflexi bacterium]|nr:type II secretion system F family protein [Chloroflexota bacterium]MDK1044102.1 type II secretion system F family protein [Anaerolineales bacterium]MCH8340271.1 type II secretion system F family protein [Chloroflexota bacterium]MCH8875981.1 type II secretion system F family protein [Chloroflexota bacterium]MCI0772577.1 type II secretion system F family protein [Chloroflexota bacterium]
MILAIVGIVVLLAVILVVVGINMPRSDDPIQERLSELTISDEPMSLEELELSQDFGQRIILPFFDRIGELSQRFTPQATLESARLRLEMAGNPMQMNPAFFLMLRFVFAVLFGGILFLILARTGGNWLQGLGISLLFLLIGFAFPSLWLSGRIKARQKAVFRAMPDALDLLTISVEAGLGFDAAMAKVHEKWINELALEFGRVIQEIRLGKLRRDALRDMADRLGVAEMSSFVAAVIQSEQLGVSMAKVLRIQSDQMRVRRRQMAEEEAHKAPIKMVFPIALLIFPSIMIILLGPAAMLLLTSPMGAILGG